MNIFIRPSRWIVAIAAVLVFNLAYGHAISEEERQAILQGGNMRYLWIGVTHMLTGLDHLLFVFGIILLLTRFMDVVKYITAFTLGHSITLFFATFHEVRVNYFLVDAFIALSLCYIAFANLDGFKKFFGIKPPNLLVMVFGFGLIHGFGLSTQLQHVSMIKERLTQSILSFNVGVELGQIAALAVMMLVISIVRQNKQFASLSRVTNFGLIFIGLYLFIMQMHGYSHTQYTDAFGFSSKHHYRDHQRMDAQREQLPMQ